MRHRQRELRSRVRGLRVVPSEIIPLQSSVPADNETVLIFLFDTKVIILSVSIGCMVECNSGGTLLIQGDSLSLPRQSVGYLETWPGLLQQNLNEFCVVSIARSEKTTDDFSSDLEEHHKRELEYYNPQILVVQIGIVDCAPRYFRKWEKAILDLIPIDIVSSGLFFVGKHLRDRSAKRAYVKQSQFKLNLQSYCRRVEQTDVNQIFLTKILQPTQELLENNPQIEWCITEYNSIIDEVACEFDIVETIRPLDNDPATEQELAAEHTLADGYHLNSDGHRRLFERLKI